jgi:hypothetical protein
VGELPAGMYYLRRRSPERIDWTGPMTEREAAADCAAWQALGYLVKLVRANQYTACLVARWEAAQRAERRGH